MRKYGKSYAKALFLSYMYVLFSMLLIQGYVIVLSFVLSNIFVTLKWVTQGVSCNNVVNGKISTAKHISFVIPNIL